MTDMSFLGDLKTYRIVCFFVAIFVGLFTQSKSHEAGKGIRLGERGSFLRDVTQIKNIYLDFCCLAVC